jgi:hypothetical protein
MYLPDSGKDNRWFRPKYLRPKQLSRFAEFQLAMTSIAAEKIGSPHQQLGIDKNYPVCYTFALLDQSDSKNHQINHEEERYG